jgi:hypothetical protein
MKPGERPRLLSLTMGGYLTAHWGATPCIKIVRTMGLDLLLLEGAAVIPKPKCRALRNADADMGPLQPIT